VEIIILLSSLLTIVTVFLITEYQRKKLEEKIEAVESDVAIYGERIVRDIAAVSDDVAIIESSNIERL
jgi:hypothetical protein